MTKSIAWGLFFVALVNLAVSILFVFANNIPRSHHAAAMGIFFLMTAQTIVMLTESRK